MEKYESLIAKRFIEKGIPFSLKETCSYHLNNNRVIEVVYPSISELLVKEHAILVPDIAKEISPFVREHWTIIADMLPKITREIGHKYGIQTCYLKEAIEKYLGGFDRLTNTGSNRGNVRKNTHVLYNLESGLESFIKEHISLKKLTIAEFNNMD